MASIIDTRREQMFPRLSVAEIGRLRRFGHVEAYGPGEPVVQVGQTGGGLRVLLAGEVEVTRRLQSGSAPIVTHAPGGFMGELAQLSGRPSLVDAHARGPVEILAIAPEALRAMLVAEAELGERVMRALILRRVGLIETGAGGPVILGAAGHPDVVRLEGFLSRNGHPHQRLDPGTDPEARALIERFDLHEEKLPIVLCPDGRMLQNPTEACLARCIGLVGPIDPRRVFDVAVVGAGPAGLAAAVYAGSEGLSVLVLDCRAFGGQAGASSRIENYLGFPTGVSGMALMARAYNQAQKFGVEMAIPDEAVGLELDPGGGAMVRLFNGEAVRARALVIASGARYRRLQVRGVEAYEGGHVHYWASPVEGRLCAGQEVALVGAGNSAGQAAVYLAGVASKVWMIVRRRDMADTMSRYLVDRILGLPNVEVVAEAEVSALHGSGAALEAVSWRQRAGGETRRPVSHLFLFIGAEPNTDWLGSCVALDDRGFILTGEAAGEGRQSLETSHAEVFAIGDVRSGSVKRVAAAVGEGAQLTPMLHAMMAAAQARAAAPASA
jgi:thioredoxin reductase (NADPH)